MVRFLKKHSFGIVLLILVGVAIYLYIDTHGRRRAIAGIGDPVQKEASGTASFKISNYTVNVEYLYSYDISGLVVSACDYTSNKYSGKFMPVDIGLAWGKVAEYNLDVDFKWEQRNRCLIFTLTDEVLKKLDENYVITHCSNNHLITPTKALKKKARKIKKGDHVRIRGYLVTYSAVSTDGTTINGSSSTVRDDTSADGTACEIIYVTDISWVK